VLRTPQNKEASVDVALEPSLLKSHVPAGEGTDNGNRADEIARYPSTTLIAGREGSSRDDMCGKVEESVEYS
jgi:hypothetical protein